MTDRMTDSEIVKTLETCCSSRNCYDCEFAGEMDCACEVSKVLLPLINRQKAKIEALQMDNEQLKIDIANANMNLESMVAEYEADKERLDNDLWNAEINRGFAEQQLTAMSDLCREQHAEIERLKAYEESVAVVLESAKKYYSALYEDAKEILVKESETKAVKEFAERLVGKAKSKRERFLFESLVKTVMNEMSG